MGSGLHGAERPARDSFAALLRSYGTFGAVSAGPWILSILGVFAIGILHARAVRPGLPLQEFQVSVTYLMVFSFLLMSPLQLPFTRFLGDRLHGGEQEALCANVIGVLTLGCGATGLAGLTVLDLFQPAGAAYRGLLLAGAVLLSGIWLAMAILSAVRRYGDILLMFLLSHGLSVAAAYSLGHHGTEGLLLGYLSGQALLFLGLLTLLLRHFPARQALAFDFLRKDASHGRLAAIGVLFAAGIWVDKLLFWFNPATSVRVVGPLRVSDIYDLPIFLAYLFILPGMAAFLRFNETVFAGKREAFYAAVNGGASLNTLNRLRDELIQTIRQGLAEIFKVQGLTIGLVMVNGKWLLNLVGISPVYGLLLSIDLVAASLQVLLLALFSVLAYLDLQAGMLLLGGLFLVTNLGLTLLSQHLGPAWYGYGFAASLVLTVTVGFLFLSRQLGRWVYRTFMLQKAVL